jgi:hypothetical protein
MKRLVLLLILSGIGLLNSCMHTGVSNHKDLDENMLDIMMYHDNLGLFLREKKIDYALWLVTGLDSSLQVISKKFEQHRKLKEPFEQSYKKSLLPSIKNIRNGLQENNWQAAIASYQTLTRKCNGCHIDLDIDKVVVDRSRFTGE